MLGINGVLDPFENREGVPGRGAGKELMLLSCEVVILDNRFIQERLCDNVFPPDSKVSASPTDTNAAPGTTFDPISELLSPSTEVFPGLFPRRVDGGSPKYDADFGRGEDPLLDCHGFRNDGVDKRCEAMEASKARGFWLDPSERARLDGRYCPNAKPTAAAPQEAELAHNYCHSRQFDLSERIRSASLLVSEGSLRWHKESV